MWSCEEIHNASGGGESLAHAAFHRIDLTHRRIADLWQRLQHNGPCIAERTDDHILRGIPPILRNALHAILEVLVAERHGDLQLWSTDNLKHPVRVNREVTNAERRVIHIVEWNLAETLGRNTLQNLFAVVERESERVRNHCTHCIGLA